MILDSLPPFVTFLLPTARFPFRQHPSTTNSSSTNLTSAGGSISHISTDTTRSSSTNSSLTDSSWNSSRSYSTPHSSLSTNQSFTSLPTPQPQLTRRHPSTLRCLKCSTDLAYTTQILSKGFTGRLGRGYLVAPPLPPPFVPTFPPKPRPKAELVNTRTERPVNRELMTGMHVVADVSCVICATVVGWKYLDACEENQRYKIGKVILERERVCVGGNWEDEDDVEGPNSKNDMEFIGEWGEKESDSTIQFDSGDEEECENLFTGVWDRDVVAKRRKIKKLSNKDSAVPHTITTASTSTVQNSSSHM